MNKIYVVGLGPGAYEELTIRADRALQEADVIIGYMKQKFGRDFEETFSGRL